ncbi:MAG: transcription termination/antitermination protein NusG, partial [bacterium]|nr:transcription termination/antitermination protein NusG [bacterium]
MAEEIIETTERKQAPATIKFTDKPNPDAFWYVVHTYSGHEQKVAITLGERVRLLDLSNTINEVLIPTQKKIIISGGKKKEIKER